LVLAYTDKEDRMEMADDKIVTYGSPAQEAPQRPHVDLSPTLGLAVTSAPVWDCHMCGRVHQDSLQAFCSDLCLLAWYDMQDANK
jgi:hypothetical protein